MTELKTLKDMQDSGEFISLGSIRAEVIKWIKDMENRTCYKSILPDCKTATVGLRKFFNLTKEDLE